MPSAGYRMLARNRMLRCARQVQRTLAFSTRLPDARMPATVDDGEHDDFVIGGSEENAVGEPAEEGAAGAAPNHWKHGWRALRGCQDGIDRAEELGTESRALILVPIVSAREVGLGRRGDD